MDLYDLMKAGSLIFSRAPARDFEYIDKLREDRANKAAIREAFGPGESSGVQWNTPRQLPSGNATALMDQQGPVRTGVSALPSIPKELFSQGLKDRGLGG